MRPVIQPMTSILSNRQIGVHSYVQYYLLESHLLEPLDLFLLDLGFLNRDCSMFSIHLAPNTMYFRGLLMIMKYKDFDFRSTLVYQALLALLDVSTSTSQSKFLCFLCAILIKVD